MAVFDQGFRVYTGPRTPIWGRFFVLTRYALGGALATKRALIFLVLSAVMPLVASALVYLHHNAEALTFFPIPVDELLPIDAAFFFHVLRLQAYALFFVFLTTGATLISADLRDNALPLYLGRSISRFEYLLGKFAVLALLGSAVTWVPCLLLFALQGSLEGAAWVGANLRIAAAMFIGSWMVIAVVGLLCLAASAAMRSRAAAEVGFGAFILGSMLLGQVLNATLDTAKGSLLAVPVLLHSAWRPLFGLAPESDDVTATAAWIALALFAAAAVFVLRRRVRAYEVVT